GDPAGRRALGLAHVPEDRLRQGLVAAFQASETSILGYQDEARFSPHHLIDRPAVRAYCAELMKRFDVRPPLPGLRSAQFSGGNQQKLVLAREISHEPKVLLVGQPTRGVDIGAIEFIHRELMHCRDRGCAILLVSVELDEILALSDRILVMAGGRIAGEVPRGKADERSLGLMMAGVKAA
ncbi:MAG: heme ABC transporter ATP-binding protein, partial [Proteobacteria bacterium]|nr:heme ABC transporter ATP-binding protein [Pseudomonadota bacterium]